jgi:hypothetical protein
MKMSVDQDPYRCVSENIRASLSNVIDSVRDTLLVGMMSHECRRQPAQSLVRDDRESRHTSTLYYSVFNSLPAEPGQANESTRAYARREQAAWPRAKPVVKPKKNADMR